jgi:hypothetical protein
MSAKLSIMRTCALLLSLSASAFCAGVPYFSEPALCPTRPEIAFVSGGAPLLAQEPLNKRHFDSLCRLVIGR